MTSPLLSAVGRADPTKVVGRRIVAWILDQLLMLAVVFAASSIAGVRVVAQTATNSRGQTITTGSTLDGSPGGFAAVAVVSLLYVVVTQVVLVAQLGWTPGKVAMGLRVVAWDGRPPGIGRALIRGLVNWVGSWFSCLWYLPALGSMMLAKGHRQPADMAASTYVIDRFYLGRMIVRTETAVSAGEISVHREEAVEALRAMGADIPIPPSGHRATEPFYDKAHDTYVVYSNKRGSWLAYDKSTDTWNPIG